MSDPDLSVVIVHFNTPDYTAQCLDSIRQAGATLGYEVILVDNASSDNSANGLAEHYPEVRLIRSLENRGVAGGNNLGIRAASGRHILLLNSDALLAPGFMERCAMYLDEHPDVAGVGGNLLNPDGSFQAGYVSFPSLWQELLIVSKVGQLLRRGYPSHSPATEIRKVDWMSTACMAFRRAALEQVGLVDEEYFMYSDETDLQYRLHRAGWKIVYLPDLKTIHFGGKSLTPWRRRYLVYRGHLLFFQKHYEPWRTAVLQALFFTSSAAKMAFWGLARLLPSLRERAQNELLSHRRVLKMALTGETPIG